MPHYYEKTSSAHAHPFHLLSNTEIANLKCLLWILNHVGVVLVLKITLMQSNFSCLFSINLFVLNQPFVRSILKYVVITRFRSQLKELFIFLIFYSIAYGNAIVYGNMNIKFMKDGILVYGVPSASQRTSFKPWRPRIGSLVTGPMDVSNKKNITPSFRDEVAIQMLSWTTQLPTNLFLRINCYMK